MDQCFENEYAQIIRVDIISIWNEATNCDSRKFDKSIQ